MNTKLYKEPNKYAPTHKLELGREIKVKGYQSYTLNGSIIPNDNKTKTKSEIVNHILAGDWIENKSVLDIGSNAGYFALMSILNGASKVDCLEIDNNYINTLQRIIDYKGIGNISIHNKNVTEYTNKADLVIALAIIHWIYSCTSDYGSLSSVVKKLADLSNELVLIEWVAPEDDAIQFFKHTDYNKDIITEEYNIENFRKALNDNFTHFELIGEVSKTRKVYLCYKYLREFKFQDYEEILAYGGLE